MRDFFAILAIILAVVGLGVFRVPDENALVAAGIKAEAQSAVYQAKHPIDIAVKGRVVTASGRIESEAEGLDLVRTLQALEGVEGVVNNLTILPNAAPFTLSFSKDGEGVQASGHVPGQSAVSAIGGALDLQEPDLTVATGVPDSHWADLALAGAQAMARIDEGGFTMTDRAVSLRATVHVPADQRAIEAMFADLPDGYTFDATWQVLDDGLPYSFVLSRDPLMGVRVVGKLPADWTPDGLSKIVGPFTDDRLRWAAKDLDAKAFQAATEAALGVFDLLPQGVVSIAPGVVTFQGGPVSQDAMDQVGGLKLPVGWALNMALVPDDPGPELGLLAEWADAELVISGRVPADFWGAATPDDVISEQLGASLDAQVSLDASPYPDLKGWSAPVWPGLRALVALHSGSLKYDSAGVRMTGVARDPDERRRVLAILGTSGEAKLQLMDDGAPPVFRVTYDPAQGAAVDGKLPAGLTPQALAKALGLDSIRGAPRVAPEGDGAKALAGLQALQPYMALLETVVLDAAPQAVSVQIVVTSGVRVDALRAAVAQSFPRGVALEVVQQPAAPAGTRRTNAFTGAAQIFVDGYWLPQLGFPVSPERCTHEVAGVAVPFAERSFVPDLGAAPALAHLAAVARACLRTGAIALDINGQATGTGIEILDRQLARRRAEAVRAALVDRGVDRARISAVGQASDQDRLELTFR